MRTTIMLHVRTMFVTSVLIAACLLTSFIGAQTDGTITFSAGVNNNGVPSNVKIAITVKKGTNEVTEADGTHTFPAYTQMDAVAGYYEVILKQAGLVSGTDFKIVGGSIHFYKVDKIDGGSSGRIDVNGTVDVGKFGKLKKIKLRMARGYYPLSGVMRLIGYSLEFSGTNGDEVQSACSVVMVYFRSSDTADEMMTKVEDALVQAGWDAAASAGSVTIVSMDSGMPLYSFSMQVRYSPETPGEELPPASPDPDDHWALTTEDA